MISFRGVSSASRLWRSGVSFVRHATAMFNAACSACDALSQVSPAALAFASRPQESAEADAAKALAMLPVGPTSVRLERTSPQERGVCSPVTLCAVCSTHVNNSLSKFRLEEAANKHPDLKNKWTFSDIQAYCDKLEEPRAVFLHQLPLRARGESRLRFAESWAQRRSSR